MSPYVAITTMNVGGREFILAEVARGKSKLGVFRHTTTASTSTDVFFMDDEPVINIFNPYTLNETADKIIHQVSAWEKVDDPISVRLTAAIDNFYLYEQGLARSMLPVLELLSPGLYVIHEAQVHPCDGAGRFFWSAYTNPQAYGGTSEKNSAIGHNNFTPSFLIPTRHPADFRLQRMMECEENLKKGKTLAGIAYHVVGMFSALLEGHHSATAALNNDIRFKCIMIEPLNGIMYNNLEGIASLGKATGKVIVRDDDNRRIVALSCPYVNIPLEELPDDSLERFLISRKSIKPISYSVIRTKMNKSAKTISKRAIPMAIYDKSAQLPRHAMVEEAAAIDYLSEEQLEALVSGEVKHNDDYIISSNLHTSIGAACNYLHVLDFERFLTFTVGILKNEELVSVHKFVAERLFGIIHPSIHEYFAEIFKIGVEKAFVAGKPIEEFDDGIIFDVSRKYMVKWEEHLAMREAAENSYDNKRKRQDMNKKKITEGQGIATLEAAARGLGLNSAPPEGIRT
ncbi:MAG: hypothetical protein FWD35_03315 [Oscillospiraceae bacterium]|nr:hypothetical protein [Oscillospiraceae bacterium]